MMSTPVVSINGRPAAVWPLESLSPGTRLGPVGRRLYISWEFPGIVPVLRIVPVLLIPDGGLVPGKSQVLQDL